MLSPNSWRLEMGVSALGSVPKYEMNWVVLI